MPLKRLLRRRERLLKRRQSAKIIAQLKEIDHLIWIMRQRAASKNRAELRKPDIDSSPASRIKRLYRDVNLIR